MEWEKFKNVLPVKIVFLKKNQPVTWKTLKSSQMEETGLRCSICHKCFGKTLF